MQADRFKPFQSGRDGYIFICDPENEAASRAEIEEILRCIVGGWAADMLEKGQISKEKFDAYEAVALDKSGPISQSYGFSPHASEMEGYLPYVCNHSFYRSFFTNTFGMLLHYYKNLPAEARKAQYVHKIVPFQSSCASNTKEFMAREHFWQVYCAIQVEFPFHDKASGDVFCAVNVHIRKNNAMQGKQKEIEKLLADKLQVENIEMPLLEYEPAILDPNQRAKFNEDTTVYVNVYILGACTYMGYADSEEKYETLYLW